MPSPPRKAGASPPLCPSWGLHCADRVSSAIPETSISQNQPAASLCQRAVPPQVRLASSPHVAGWKFPETNTPPQGPSACASGERDTPAPSPSGRVIPREFPCGVNARLPGVEAGLLDSLDWPFPLLCILSTGPPFTSQIGYLQ